MKKLLLLICIVSIIAPAHGQIISTIAGNGTGAYDGDGGQATAATIHWHVLLFSTVPVISILQTRSTPGSGR